MRPYFSCYPQRTEFLYTSRDRAEYDEITEMFGDLYPDVSVPKNAGHWIASVQHHMARAGQHRSASAVDLMIAATAAHHGLTVLHDDADYRTVAQHGFSRWRASSSSSSRTSSTPTARLTLNR